MAPHSYKKKVKFAKSRSPIPSRRKSVTNSADSYANIVLHYLSKLKTLFKSSSTNERENGNYPEASYDSTSKPILKKDHRRLRSSSRDPDSKQKAYDIVSAAIQYGCANDIIEQVGNYFLVKTKTDQKVANRRPTPGPDYIRCASCKNLASRYRSVTDVGSKNRTVEDRSPPRRKRSRSNTSLVNYCPKCYAKLKSKRKV